MKIGDLVHRESINFAIGFILAMPVLAPDAVAQADGEFPLGGFDRIQSLPPGRFRQELKELPAPAQARAREWLRGFHFTDRDVESMHVDANGGICFGCHFHRHHDPAESESDAPEEAADDDPQILASAVPVSPFPDSLKFNSLPGATNVIYINFSGMLIEGTEWNTVVGRSGIPTLPFSTDSDFTTFSAAEQVAIKRIWQRMAEDYAPFNVNVTTVPPATITNRTAVALITRNTDANGQPNPFSSAGGVAYVNVFGRTDFASRYSPAFVYHNNLSNNESFIAEAASHEVGHNLGLSHDGTSSSEYYGGHGSGEISWGPIMGTGYNRNVSQWSKGEYLNANNTQDDLAVIAGKLGYRPDDHGNTPGAATQIVITNSTQIVSTNLENDPHNNNPANKGIIERTTDVDVFSFVTGNGPVSITASPWVMPSGTRGGNLDILLEIRNEAGEILASNNAPDRTAATVSATLSEGRYFLHVRNSGAGNPFASSPSGYTVYGSIGTYYLSGSITAADGFNPPPIAQLAVNDLTAVGVSSHTLTVTYSDDFAVNVSTIGTGDLRVTGPNGYNQLAQIVSVDNTINGSPRVATYTIPPPSGAEWIAAHNGSYGVFMEPEQVADTQGAFVAAGALGGFNVALPVPVYTANMDSDPGWTLDGGPQNNPGWQYGAPNYGGNANAPSSGFTGINIIAYNLSGDYQRNLSVRYATTPQIPANNASSLTLQFRRWLRLTNQGTGVIQISVNNGAWQTLWSGSSISDGSWQLVQYSLPSSASGSATFRLRWGISSGNRPAYEIGWHIDDVVILGDGVIDADPPQAALGVADLAQGGSPSHSCSVTYTDATAVRRSSLDEFNLVVTGPNGYTTYIVDGSTGAESSILGFIGADLPEDGSPITASYDIPAPDGSWGAEDNGTYTITLRAGTVEDTLNNSVSETVLGTFQVAISQASPGELIVSPDTPWAITGRPGGPFSPETKTYTLSNTGGSPLNWSASKTASWIDLSEFTGSLAPGASVDVVASLNAGSTVLGAGEYGDLISFANNSSGLGTTNRQVSLVLAVTDSLKVASYGINGDGIFQMTLTADPGQSVTVEWSENLKDWQPLGTFQAGETGTLQVTDPESANRPQRFYIAR